MEQEKNLKESLQLLLKKGKENDLQRIFKTHKNVFMKLYKMGFTAKELHEKVQNHGISCSYQTFRKAFAQLKSESLINEQTKDKSEKIIQEQEAEPSIKPDYTSEKTSINIEDYPDNINEKLKKYDIEI